VPAPTGSRRSPARVGGAPRGNEEDRFLRNFDGSGITRGGAETGRPCFVRRRTGSTAIRHDDQGRTLGAGNRRPCPRPISVHGLECFFSYPSRKTVAESPKSYVFTSSGRFVENRKTRNVGSCRSRFWSEATRENSMTRIFEPDGGPQTSLRNERRFFVLTRTWTFLVAFPIGFRSPSCCAQRTRIRVNPSRYYRVRTVFITTHSCYHVVYA